MYACTDLKTVDTLNKSSKLKITLYFSSENLKSYQKYGPSLRKFPPVVALMAKRLFFFRSRSHFFFFRSLAAK